MDRSSHTIIGSSCTFWYFNLCWIGEATAFNVVGKSLPRMQLYMLFQEPPRIVDYQSWHITFLLCKASIQCALGMSHHSIESLQIRPILQPQLIFSHPKFLKNLHVLDISKTSTINEDFRHIIVNHGSFLSLEENLIWKSAHFLTIQESKDGPFRLLDRGISFFLDNDYQLSNMFLWFLYNNHLTQGRHQWQKREGKS